MHSSSTVSTRKSLSKGFISMRQFSLVAAASVFIFSSSFRALAVTVVNIDFSPAVDAASAYEGVNKYSYEFSGLGAAPDTGTVWNHLYSVNDTAPGGGGGDIGVYYPVGEANVSGPTSLVDSLGNGTSVSASFNSGGAFAVSDTSGNINNIATDAVDLMREYLIAFSDGFDDTVTLTGLPANQPVILYLYGEGDNLFNNRHTVFTAGGVTGSTTGDAGGVPLTEGFDYTVLSGVVADSSGNVTIQYAPNGGGEGPFNGLQLIYDLGVGHPGDTNGDNVVDVTDYENIRSNFRSTGLLSRLDGDIAGPNDGNAGDGVVDFYDFVAWQENFGNSYSTVSGITSTVPEPTTCALALAVIGLAIVRGRFSHSK